MTPKQLKGKTCQHDLATFKGRTIRKLIGGGGGGGGGGRSTKKKYSPKGKLNEKKIHARQLILKNIHAMA